MYCECIFARSTSLLSEKKWVLNAVFDFTYEQMKFADHIQKWINEF